VVTNILLRCAVNPGALDNIKLVQVFELLQIAADALAHTERRAEDETMSGRTRPQVMRLTEAAADRIKAVMANADHPIAAIRVGVKNGGCAGMSYFMEYAESLNPLDEVIEDKGVRILVDPKAVLFLLGTEMDYKIDKLSAQFVFNNPNQTAACGCGESVQIEPASDAT
jgi:iron-sulfur cluster assembly protein